MTASLATAPPRIDADADAADRPLTVSDLVPGTSRQAVLLAYDLLHFLILHGNLQPREVVVNYLVRAGMCARHTRRESRLRAFERFKGHLARLGVRYRNVRESHGQGQAQSLLLIEQPARAKRALEDLLERTIPRDERLAADCAATHDEEPTGH